MNKMGAPLPASSSVARRPRATNRAFEPHAPFLSRRSGIVRMKFVRDRRAFLIRLAFPVVPDGGHARGVTRGDWL